MKKRWKDRLRRETELCFLGIMQFSGEIEQFIGKIGHFIEEMW